MKIPKLRSAIVLVHGLLGFDELKLCGWTVASYFPGIPQFLGGAGNRVLTARVGMTHGIADRAAQLKGFLDEKLPDEPVHIIAHSMGGLDARYMIAKLGMADRVLSLTTIGTPHRGTSFADWGIRRFERVLKPLFDLLAIPRQAFYDLTTESCRRFNEEVPDSPQVRYLSVAGRHTNDWRSLRWQFFHHMVEKLEGPNDGIVSLASAQWGADHEVWDGDHLSLVNWPDPASLATGRWQDRTPQYGQLICRLAEAGF